MITKQAIGEYIEACQAANLSADTAVDQLKIYVTKAAHAYEIAEVGILREGDFNP